MNNLLNLYMCVYIYMCMRACVCVCVNDNFELQDSLISFRFRLTQGFKKKVRREGERM